MNYKYLSKYHYIYRLSIGGDRSAHVEKLPIAYANKHYMYVIQPGSDELRRLTLEPNCGCTRGDIFTEVNEAAKLDISNYIVTSYGKPYYESYKDFWFLIDDLEPLKKLAGNLRSYDIPKLYLTTEMKRLTLAIQNSKYNLEKRTEELEAVKRQLEALKPKS